MRGRLSPFIELGVGFNPDLTARDNVIINAIMLGLTRKQARERFDEIIAFAELEEFLDLKLKNYSSGMSVRLAFSVAIQVDADVLLVDEVLAVGDAAFQQKCFEQFHRLKDEGKTIVFVTHDMGAVERFCDRAMLLERGDGWCRSASRTRSRAPTTSSTSAACVDEQAASDETDRFGDQRGGRDHGGVVRGRRTASASTALAQGEPLRMCVEVAFHDADRAPAVRAAPAQRGAPHDLRDLAPTCTTSPTGRFARRRAS